MGRAGASRRPLAIRLRSGPCAGRGGRSRLGVPVRGGQTGAAADRPGNSLCGGGPGRWLVLERDRSPGGHVRVGGRAAFGGRGVSGVGAGSGGADEVPCVPLSGCAGASRGRLLGRRRGRVAGVRCRLYGRRIRRAGETRGEGDTLWIPAASEASFFLEAEQDLELESIAPRGVRSLDVVWEVEGGASVAASLTAESTPTLRLPLSPVGEQAANAVDDDWLASVRPARLVLRAAGAVADSGGEEMGVVLRRPRLTADARTFRLSARNSERRRRNDCPGRGSSPEVVLVELRGRDRACPSRCG